MDMPTVSAIWRPIGVRTRHYIEAVRGARLLFFLSWHRSSGLGGLLEDIKQPQ